MTALPDRGRLGVLPLPRLLALLEGEGFRGTLRLEREGCVRELALSAGRVTRVRGDARSGGAIAALERAGVIGAEDARRAASVAATKSIPEEKALLALRLVRPADLLRAIRAHERGIALDCFAWPDGSFELRADAGTGEASDGAALAHDVVSLVHAGVVRHWPLDRTLGALGPAASARRVPGESYARVEASLGATPGLTALAPRLDGTAPLGEAVRLAGHAESAAAALVLDVFGALAPASEVAEASGATPSPTVEAEAAPALEIVIERPDARPQDPDAAPAGAGGTLAASAEASRVRRTLLEKHAALDGLDHYGVLDVPRDADAAAIRRAYVASAKLFHPDAILRLGLDDLHAEANAVFARVGKAQAVLSDPEQRRAYDDAQQDGGLDEAQRVLGAETFYRKGEVLLRKGNFDDALQFLRPAVDLCGDDAVYRTALGWALFRKQAPDPDAARAELARAVELDPGLALAHQRLAAVLRAQGKESEAAPHAARARELEAGARKSP